MKTIFRYLGLVTFISLALVVVLRGDTFMLKDGSSVEGTVVDQDDTQIVVEVETAGGTIHYKEKLLRANIAQVIKLTPQQIMERAREADFAKLKKYQLDPQTSRPADYYNTALNDVFRPYLQKYPGFPHEAEVKETIAAWEAERDQVLAGKRKIAGQWLDAQEAAQKIAQGQLDQAQSALTAGNPERAAALIDQLLATNPPAEIKDAATRLRATTWQAYYTQLVTQKNQVDASLTQLAAERAAAVKALIPTTPPPNQPKQPSFRTFESTPQNRGRRGKRSGGGIGGGDGGEVSRLGMDNSGVAMADLNKQAQASLQLQTIDNQISTTRATADALQARLNYLQGRAAAAGVVLTGTEIPVGVASGGTGATSTLRLETPEQIHAAFERAQSALASGNAAEAVNLIDQILAAHPMSGMAVVAERFREDAYRQLFRDLTAKKADLEKQLPTDPKSPQYAATRAAIDSVQRQLNELQAKATAANIDLNSAGTQIAKSTPAQTTGSGSDDSDALLVSIWKGVKDYWWALAGAALVVLYLLSRFTKS